MQIQQNIVPTKTPEIIVNKTGLQKAFADCCLITERKNEIPILSNARVVSNGLNTFVTATDLDLQLTCAIPCNGDSRASFSVPTHSVSDFIKAAPECDLVTMVSPNDPTIESCETQTEADDSDTHAKLKFDELVYSCQSLPAYEFPAFKQQDYTHKFMMSGVDFFEALDSTKFAISNEKTRYYLGGVHITYAPGTLCFVATDGHKLVTKSFELHNTDLDTLPHVIIPTKAVHTLHRLFRGKNCPQNVLIKVNETHIRISWENRILDSKLIDGTFPDYQRIIPQNNDRILKVNSESLLRAVNAVSKVSNSKGGTITLYGYKHNLNISLKNPDRGMAEQRIDCEFSDALKIGFNSDYLVSIIKAIYPGKKSGELTFAFENADSPTLITGDREGLKIVLMPVKI